MYGGRWWRDGSLINLVNKPWNKKTHRECYKSSTRPMELSIRPGGHRATYEAPDAGLDHGYGMLEKVPALLEISS